MNLNWTVFIYHSVLGCFFDICQGFFIQAKKFSKLHLYFNVNGILLFFQKSTSSIIGAGN